LKRSSIAAADDAETGVSGP